MATLTLTTPSLDCRLIYAGSNTEDYITVRNGLVGSAGPGISSFRAGQSFEDPDYQNSRSAIFFDASALPDNAVISAAVLTLHVLAIHDSPPADGHFNVVLVSGRDVTSTPVGADYGRLRAATTSFGSANTADMTAGATIDINLNATGIAAISPSGITQFGLRSDGDINGTEPTGRNWVDFSSVEHEDNPAPQLVITYTSASPAVQTDAASSITTTGATMNGTLTDDGGAACDCNFEWGRTTNYGTTTSAQSKETSETFLQALTGLIPNTLYHFRAKAVGSTAYGSDKTFMTLAPVPGDGAAPGPSVVSGLVGTIRHYWKPGQYRMEIGLGGYGRAFSTVPFGYSDAPSPEQQPDLTPVPTPEICEMAAEAWNRYLIHVSNLPTPGDPQARAQWEREKAYLWDTYTSLHAACTSTGTRYAATGISKSPNIEQLHRARKPLKPWQPGQTDQALQRLARSPIHQAMVSDVAFTADDHNSISWAAGSIVFSNGVEYDIAAGSLDLTATHYIYYVRGDNALRNTTSITTAVSETNTLIAVATAVASGGYAKIIVLYGDIQGYIQTGDGVLKSLFNENTILKADTDDTPEALTVAEQRLVGRITSGEITGLTNTQVMALLSGGAGADFSMNSNKITSVTDPASAQDAATKTYTDDAAFLWGLVLG